jgi:predicted Zn-ribbon and HTH transcriptional regulator
MPATLLPSEDTIDPGAPDGGDDGDPDSDKPVRWVTVATFWTPPQAHLAVSKLESEEIDCQLANENIVAADFLLAPAVGGIKILVPEHLAEKARALLSTSSSATMTVPPAQFGACPECGSTNIDRPILQAKTFWAAIVALMLLGSVVMAPLALAGFAYYVIMWRPWRCRDCGDVFRRGEDRRGFPIRQNLKPSPAADE